MRVKCDFCGSVYEDNLNSCPSCGAANSKRNTGDVRPRTIAQLQDWYKARNLPPASVTRFFIGENCTEAKAFGVYQNESGEFVVYKNKADGTRAIRYQGGDEEYAVNELYLKLKDEIVHQKNLNRNSSRSVTGSSTATTGQKAKAIMAIVVFLIFAISFTNIINSLFYRFGTGKHNGYYEYNNDVYYHRDDDWYIYDTSYGYSDNGILMAGGWQPVNYGSQHYPDAKVIESNYDDYYVSRNWTSSLNASDWTDSSYYSNYSSDWSSDSDYDWDSGDSWDSGGTDWDSDW